MRTLREAPCARNSISRKRPLVLRLAVGDSRWTVARSTINDVHGTFVLFFTSASLDARVRIRARKTRRRGTARKTANTQRNGSREFRAVSRRLCYLSSLGKRG